MKNGNIKYLLVGISLLPILFFTSKYVGIINFIYPCGVLILSGVHYSYMGDAIDFDLVSSKPLKEWFNVLFSDKGKGIDTTGKGLTYDPNHYNPDGVKRDDGSIEYSINPEDGGINRSYDFGSFSDVSTRKQSAAQLSLGLEFDNKVNGRTNIAGKSRSAMGPVLNESGGKGHLDYCKSRNYNTIVNNTIGYRQELRDYSQGKV